MDVMDAGKAIALGIASIPRDAYLGLERTLQDLNLSDGRSYYTISAVIWRKMPVLPVV